MPTIKITIDSDKNTQLLTKMLRALKFVTSIEKERKMAKPPVSISQKEHDSFQFPVSKIRVKSGSAFSRDEIYGTNGR